VIIILSWIYFIKSQSKTVVKIDKLDVEGRLNSTCLEQMQWN
jgi:hypothetical protein